MSRYTPGCGKRIAEKKTLNRWNEVHATIAYNIMQKRTVYARNHHFVAKFNSGKRDEHCIALRTQSTIIPFFFLYDIIFISLRCYHHTLPRNIEQPRDTIRIRYEMQISHPFTLFLLVYLAN